jgi:radical SAM superfamily enzyme YgiQ (UPF0313 family)
MKVLLIYPPIKSDEVYSKYSKAAPCMPPLGICYLASYLLDANYDVKIIDCVVERLTLGELKSRILKYSPTIVGVSSTTVAFYHAKKVISLVKSIDSEIHIILGGAHITALPEETMYEAEDIDVGVIGEGEETLLELVNKITNKKTYTSVKGIIYRNNGTIVRNNPRCSNKNLDSINFPARELLVDLSSYSHTAFRGKKGELTTTMITSRGCPFKCTYCDQSIFGRTWRKHSADYVFAEMKLLNSVFGVKFITIEDDNFTLDKKRVVEICNKIITNSLDVKWAISGRVNSLDNRILRLMKKAGCETIYIGIESGSPRILKLIKKGISKQEVNEGIRIIKKCGLRVIGSFILGIPSETKEEMEQTVNFALSLPLDGASFFIFTPYPNTELRATALKCGKVSTNWQDYSGHPSKLPYIPHNMSQKELLDFQAKAYKKFLLRPSYIYKYFMDHSIKDIVQKGYFFIKAFYFSKIKLIR